MNNNPPEFAAQKLVIDTLPSIMGLQAWSNHNVMISFFPINFKGETLKNEFGNDKVYDLFLTTEQMEYLIREYNKQTADEFSVLDKLKD
jgi:hypothetical protein